MKKFYSILFVLFLSVQNLFSAGAADLTFLFQFTSDFDFPITADIDSTNTIFVTDAVNGLIKVFDSQGNFQRQFGSGVLNDLISLAIDRDDNIFVADQTFGVKVFNNQGDFLFSFGQGLGINACDVNIASSGEVFVADSDNNRVVVFDVGGNFKRQFSTQLPPCGMNFDTQGNIFVEESSSFDAKKNIIRNLDVKSAFSNVIEVFDLKGNFLFSFGETVLGAPWGIVIFGDEIIVSDGVDNDLKIFNLSGQLQSIFGKEGTGPGQFSAPNIIRLQRNTGILFVPDSLNNRIQVFSLLSPSERLLLNDTYNPVKVLP